MHAPERWPYGEIESWWAWRDHLDRVQDPNIATLKREADCEIARILRCCEFEVGAEAARAAGAGAGRSGAGLSLKACARDPRCTAHRSRGDEKRGVGEPAGADAR